MCCARAFTLCEPRQLTAHGAVRHHDRKPHVETRKYGWYIACNVCLYTLNVLQRSHRANMYTLIVKQTTHHEPCRRRLQLGTSVMCTISISK
jgi:hypothetical protein